MKALEIAHPLSQSANRANRFANRDLHQEESPHAPPYSRHQVLLQYSNQELGA
jgi:hypothetical protein